MKIDDRVRWRYGKPEDSPEHNGKLIDKGQHSGMWSVRWDDGIEEWCHEEDLEVVDAHSST